MKFIKNYKYSIILLLSILLGGVIGLIMGENAKIFKPLGKLFLNMIFTALVPIVFFSISSSIANMESSKKLGKLLGITVTVFGTTALISGILGVISFKLFDPTKGLDLSTFGNLINSNQNETMNSVGILEKIVSSISVGDFSELLTRSNLLAMILFSIIVGFATMLCKEEGKVFAKFLNSGAAVTMKIISIIMYYAPIGLGAYFASIIGELGGQILTGYLKVFVLYTVISILYFGVFFTIYAYIADGKKGIKSFWKNSVEPSVTAVATCSSAACIPVNIKAAKKMGVPDSIAKIIMPIGVNIHKDGSVIGGVYKIMFLFGIFGRDMESISSLMIILILGLLIGAVVGAVPGGGAIGEMLILSMFNFPQEALAIMLVIATIIDIPATLLNSSGNTVCTMMISKFMGNK
ncbi:dicarboxylate/amino acid:cation symporter [Clostridium botulinum]|uniref:Dicarboxylate/amino acid:cation symporter n=1 Tax=Clostridium botulinum TaxID=1491 RepID=A0A6B4JLG6_CLOBO|nr:dicarboxylate/amino acid:cation symporter [Clostridium botulinum]EES47875.1 proton/sodium-glutamate symporter [Clostridium botulinum E1 str. 'BoNT E Beluga']MBY6761079.1 dicarboxylate/amino acid:cation symporter [Clostridium botulinum]MBY6919629.1 dicarboxylate/amino acid:cation symporter [Clostridium botulinum]MCR1130873.1 dicarboxylate/amino acid:cation symporter [Clostridium botulinum]NFH70931.1 dicarboxylate/amino acid:cation symporter [Clostridium botulinum]